MKKGKMSGRAGLRNTFAFTLVELLITLGLVGFLATAMVTTLNPLGILFKGSDAQRKKDLNRIKTAFEDFYNDQGSYVNNSGIYKNGNKPNYTIAKLNLASNCKTSIFSPYLKSWPCSPGNIPYSVEIDPLGLGKFNNYMVCTKLENVADKNIPTIIRKRKDVLKNYCVSSGNVDWAKIITSD